MTDYELFFNIHVVGLWHVLFRSQKSNWRTQIPFLTCKSKMVCKRQVVEQNKKKGSVEFRTFGSKFISYLYHSR